MERHQRHTTFDASFDDLNDAARLRRIESAFDEVAALAKNETTRQRFAERLLHYSVEAVAAAGGSVWELDDKGEPVATQSVHFESLRLSAGGEAETDHARLIASAFQAGHGAVVPPHSMTDAIGTAVNPTEFSLLIQPVMLMDRAVAVLELFLAPDVEQQEQRATAEVVESLAELASEFFLRDALRRDKSNAQILGDFDQLLRQIHRVPKLGETAQAIVNQGRRFLECDRVSLLVCKRGACKLQAVTGAEAVNRRSNTVRALERLVEGVLAHGESFYSFDETTEATRDVQPLLNAYRTACSFRQLVIVPLLPPSETGQTSREEPLGALVVESFQDRLPAWMRPRVELIRVHCATALQNALRNSRRSLASRLIPKWLSKGAAAVAVVALVVATLVLVPANFSIEAKGRLQPLDRREIFAPSAGIVRAIHVSHSQKVAANETLLVLENPALELEYERVRGELQTVRERVLALEATRGTLSARDAKDMTPGLIVAQTEELKERLANLETQKKLIETQRESLVLKSPLAGEVITWKPDDVLKDRPVERGQRLVTVASPQGVWVLELLIPDQSVGHVLNAQKEFGDDLAVTYILATDPSRTFASRINSVASSAEMYEDHQPYVLATVDLKSNEVPAMRPGATVVAKVHCGRRSLGYVWLRELFETVQRHVMF